MYYLRDFPPYADSMETPAFDKHEACLGLKHRDIPHMLELLRDNKAPRPNRLKALRFLIETLPDNEHTAADLGAVEVLKNYISMPHNGLVLNGLVALNTLLISKDISDMMINEIPRLVEFLDPEGENAIRSEAAHTLRLIAEHSGPVDGFLEHPIPTKLAAAVSGRNSETSFIIQAFGLLSRITNKQQIRIKLIESNDFLTLLVRSFTNSALRQVSIILASNIAMDPTHKGKIALLNADILASISIFLEATDPEMRYSIISLMALLAVPKEGKHKISTDHDIPDLINNIARTDEDESCRDAAEEVRILVSELPLGKAIMGGSKDISRFTHDSS